MDLYTRRATSILMIVAPVVTLIVWAIHSTSVLESALPSEIGKIIPLLAANAGLTQVNFILIWAGLILWIVAVIKLAVSMLDGAGGFSARMAITLLSGMVAVHSLNIAVGLGALGAAEAGVAGSAPSLQAATTLLTAGIGIGIVADLLFYLSLLVLGVAIIQGKAFHQAFGWVIITGSTVGIINTLMAGSSADATNVTIQMLTYVVGVSWSVVLGVTLIRASK